MAEQNRKGEVTPTAETIRLSELVFDKGLYPRVEGHDPERVQVYARDLDQIEAAGRFISVNGDNKMVDGRHRQLAYMKRADGKDDPVITVYRYAVVSPGETLLLACRLQDLGKSLSDNDKVEDAKKLHGLGMSGTDIASALGVSAPTVSGWLSRTIKEEKERQRDTAYAMWLACHSLEEIAVAVGVTAETVSQWTMGFSDSSASVESENFHGFDPPIYNIWKQQDKSAGPSHFGNSESRWVDNLLWLYTGPADIVIDPFAGSGSTIDVCKERKRRYFVSDRKPIVERPGEIRQHDLIGADGSVSLLKPPQWKDVKLVYLDPPYWKQAEGQYSDAPTDLANMPLEQFNAALSGIVKAYAAKVSDAYIALIIQPTQWNAPDRKFTDHVGDMLRAVKLPVEMRISVPYESQQCNAQMVEWAKANRTPLVLTREIVVWRV